MHMMTSPLAALEESRLGAVKRLLAGSFPSEPPDLIDVELVRARDPRIGVGLVACSDGRPVGALLGGKPRPGRLFVAYLVVASEHRREGLARRLLDQAVHMAGTEKLELLVDDDNFAAQRLYAAGGLAPCNSPAPMGQTAWRGEWRSDLMGTRPPLVPEPPGC